MIVSAREPFQIIYSLYAHEYLGYLFESFAVQVNEHNHLTFKHQNISHKNAEEFASGLDETDYEIIKIMDSIQQDVVYKKFNTKKLTPAEFYLKVYDPEKGDKAIQDAIANYVDNRKSQILPLLHHKEVYIMGNDGEPAWKKIEVAQDKGTMLFHFRRNEDNTHYFPTIKHREEKVEFQYNGSQIVCKNPAWLLVGEDKLITFRKNVDGNKIKPFLNKKFIVIPKSVEEKYYNNFITQLVAHFDVFAKGFDINTEVFDPVPILTFKELATNNPTLSLFDEKGGSNSAVAEDDGKLVFDLSFEYGSFKFSAGSSVDNSVKLEKIEDNYIFHKVKRIQEWETEQILMLREMGLDLRNGKASVPKAKAFSWINMHTQALRERGYQTYQHQGDNKKYFLGSSSINIEVRESNDWFDIYAKVKFGEFEIPFIHLKDLVLSKKREFELPNGEIAVIPEEWLTQYSELFAFSEDGTGEQNLQLKKHHLALIQELDTGNLAKVTIDRKLENLKNFDHIDDYPLPVGLKGDLRPYQKAGYNWLNFLSDYNFGGCLADDMGLGKTVQTLTMLQRQKELGASSATLLIMPTSLVYNWEMEARKFVPELKILVYTGTYRDKNVEQFADYDVVLTSYGITRIDVDLLKTYRFHYIILDESQAIKNPSSNIARAVKELQAKYRLILTGTPIENSTMDLWSQMSFINPGLLGTQKFFKDDFLTAIEKKNDADKKKKLYAIIKPFLLRRKKDQVLTELPPKVEQVWYSQMSSEQESEYEEVKSHYRNRILEEIDTKGMGKSQILLLQGLTKLRQIANHPIMVDENYEGTSGKMDDVLNMLHNAISKDHKVLVFSQFVKHLSIFKEKLIKEKVDFAYLDGSTKDRQAQVEKFQENEDMRVFLISLKAGGLGLNLTAADYVFILDPWWNPAVEAQAIDRAHRMGQKNTVHTYKFITKNTVEEKILNLQQSKRQLADDLITTEESFVKNLTKADIQEILN